MDWSLPTGFSRLIGSSPRPEAAAPSWPKTTGLALATLGPGSDRPGTRVLSFEGEAGQMRWARLSADNKLEVQTERKGDFRKASDADKANMKATLRGYVQREGNPTLSSLRKDGVEADTSRPFAQQPGIREVVRRELADRAKFDAARGWGPRPPVTEADITRHCESLESNSKTWNATLGAFLRS